MPSRKHRRILAQVFSWLTIGALVGLGVDRDDEPSWNQFRGHNSAGVAAAGDPPVTFGPGTNQSFRIGLAPGASSPCIWKDRIFLTASEGTALETLCLDAESGRILWRKRAPGDQLEAVQPTEGSTAASTPATDGTYVISYFGSRGLFCYDFGGTEIWSQPMTPAVHVGGFGSGTSPLIARSKVILNRDQATGSKLLAFELSTGKSVWTAERPDLVSSYSTPVLWNYEKESDIVVAGSLQLRAYNLNTGAERWRVRGLPPVVCTTPVLGDGLLLFAGWSNGKAESALESFDELLRALDKDANGTVSAEEFDHHSRFKGFFATFNPNGDDRISREEWEMARSFLQQGENCMLAIRPGQGDITETGVVWKQTRGLPYVPSPIYHDGFLYVVKDGGLVSCFEAKSGRAQYMEERVGSTGTYYSSPVVAGNRIYLCSVDGKITVVRTGNKPEVLGRSDLHERLVSTPAIDGRSLYVRTTEALWKFKGR